MITFGWFMLGAGVALLLVGSFFFVSKLLLRRNKSRFDKFIEGLKAAAKAEEEKGFVPVSDGKEISELTFRDKHGVMNKVRIIIDHDLNDMKIGSKQEMEDMLKSGEAGTLSDLMSGHKVSEDAMGKVQDFVFSPQAVRDMRSSGLEPDEVVTKMLKASGRME